MLFIGETPEAGKILQRLKLIEKDLKDQKIIHDHLGFCEYLLTM